MISSQEACAYVQQELPDISEQLPQTASIYDTLHVVSDYAVQKVQEHNYSRLKQCFALAEALYEKGSGTVRCAVENVMVFSISRILTLAQEDRCQIKSLIPQSLQSLYRAQVLHHGY